MYKTDTQIISEYINGDEGAFKLLVERYLKPVYNFVYRIAGGRQSSDDIVQEVFVKVWKNIRKYKTGENFGAWLFSIARNTAIDWLRKKRNLVFSDFENEEGENILVNNLADESLLPDELVECARSRKLIENLMAELPFIYKEVLLLRYNNQFTFEEISRILKKPLDTVKSRHRRGLMALRKLLENI